MRAADRANQLIEIDLDGTGVPVLRALDEKDHQEGDNGGAGVDDKLPCIAEVKERPRGKPQNDHQGGEKKSRGAARPLSCDLRETAETHFLHVAHLTGEL